jgi:hypothetical protein
MQLGIQKDTDKVSIDDIKKVFEMHIRKWNYCAFAD